MMIKAKKDGFSLTEVLMAVGILSIGLMLVATLFPAALYLTTVASERTMAAIVADGAFAKIKLFGLTGTPSSDSEDYSDFTSMNSIEFSYPSAEPAGGVSQYYWSALCKKTSLEPTDTEYLITVFVSRKTNPAHKYLSGDRPKAVKIDVTVQTAPNDDELQISDGNEMKVNPPTTILDNATGKIYRVIDRKIDSPKIVVLDKGWEDTPLLPNDNIWLVPPPNSGGKNADVEVFQEIIRF